MSVVTGSLGVMMPRGSVMDDNGVLHDNVQDAENAASSFIWIGPGTFNESLLVDTSALRVIGSGRGSLIDGSSDGDDAIRVTASNVSISNLSYQSTASDSRGLHGESGSDELQIDRTWCIDTDNFEGMRFEDDNVTVSRYTAESGIGANALTTVGLKTIISICRSRQADSAILAGGDDAIISNTVVNSPSGTGARGLDANSNDCTFIGCRVLSAPGDGIFVRMGSTDNIVANNRVSGSGGSDINDNGTSTLLDANRTGAAN